MPPEFSFCITELITIDSPVSAPAGIVYSTNPHKAEAANGKTYFVKGPEPEIVFAEIGGCLLAASVGLLVPAVAICSAEGRLYAGSEKVDQAFRDVSIPLKRPERVANIGDLHSVIAVDAWLGNTDRNLGNVLAGPSARGRIELVMIDFEKSAALRRHPRIKSTLIEYRSLWPTGELGQRARELKPLYPPLAILQNIIATTEDRCREVLRPLVQALGNEVPWVEDSIGAVISRAKEVNKIVEAVWQSI
jgi:hypothetical protein